ncbi:3'(2'),5'-bisphosphate nucleotidase CysQ [Methylovirgula sp. 4M-Z18]|uniref:3'(2'),5'-bisphosphate nucleotidase CysQ n=1 Tax=Methylovirgula sp. 4M-Z18 TaxID=2293567 RepID=UPI000E2F0D58|nr:3'(2'),5'-bisphosphate nucleotidase CysQ [Methylovirgula sp. 4M-Z18]
MTSSIPDPAAARDILVRAVEAAGPLALRYFREGESTSAKVAHKHGNSPVTEADHLVDEALAKALRPAFPEAGWLSEESADDETRLDKDLTLIVDPIDGTRGFMTGDSCWTICAALVHRGRPIAGVVYAPARDETFAAALGHGAVLNGRTLRLDAWQPEAGLRIAGPRSAIFDFERLGYTIERRSYVPSLAYRIALVAADRADAAVATKNSHDWDIAAIDLIVAEAGGRLTDLAGEPPRYNCPVPRHPPLIASKANLHGILLEALPPVA